MQVNMFARTNADSPVSVSGRRLYHSQAQSDKIQNDSHKIQYCWRYHGNLCCIRFYNMSVVLNFRCSQLRLRSYNRPFVGTTFKGSNYKRPPNTASN